MANANIVIESRVKEYAKEKQGAVKFSGDSVEALDKKVKELIDNAMSRAVANGRITVQSQDF